ncbi:hypothetical protein [Luteolibacter marinus]|uniref:hypothetical protein n=1 Tax=Luteolibacter marinus TaxID=2776705 RepID=UPI00186795F1|nr:hypothetical protein [Luteolibacter marinus]
MPADRPLGDASVSGHPHGAAIPAERVRRVFHNSHPVSRQIEFARLLAEADASTIADIRAMFLEFDQSGLQYDNEWRMLWHHWGTLDPEGALDQLRKEIANGGDYGPGPQALIFSAWAARDPKAAAAAMREIGDPREFEASYLGAIGGMPMAEATRFAEDSTFEDGAFASRVAENLADRQLRESNSIPDLKVWYEGLDESLRRAALDHVYWRVRTADFADAADWIRNRAEAGEDTRRIAVEMTNAYLKRGDLTGLDWYLGLPAAVREDDKLREWASGLDTGSVSYREWAAAHADASRELEAIRSAADGAP